MSASRYAARVDANQADIVKAMRGLGASVYVLKLPVDLLVGINGRTALVEVKDPRTAYGRRGLNSNQQAFSASWCGGTVALVDSVEAARRLIGVMQA